MAYVSEFQKVKNKCLEAVDWIECDCKEQKLEIKKEINRNNFSGAKADIERLMVSCKSDMEFIIFDYLHELQNWNKND